MKTTKSITAHEFYTEFEMNSELAAAWFLGLNVQDVKLALIALATVVLGIALMKDSLRQ